MAAQIIPFPVLPANDNSGDPPPSAPATLSRPFRRQIETAIERLIALLDTFDGDCDIEDDDPQGQADEDCVNMAIQGHTDDWVELLPKYGDDQTKGPTNSVSAYQDWQRTQGWAA